MSGKAKAQQASAANTVPNTRGQASAVNWMTGGMARAADAAEVSPIEKRLRALEELEDGRTAAVRIRVVQQSFSLGKFEWNPQVHGDPILFELNHLRREIEAARTEIAELQRAQVNLPWWRRLFRSRLDNYWRDAATARIGTRPKPGWGDGINRPEGSGSQAR